MLFKVRLQFLSLSTTRSLTTLRPLPRPQPAPSLPGMISNFLPLMPPHISSALLTGSRYLSLVNQAWKDGCVLLFLLGLGVLSSRLFGGSSLVSI